MSGGMQTVDVLGPAHGGTSVARVDGRAVFVRGALPGEQGVPVALDEAKDKARFLTGEVVDADAIAVPSPHRVAPVCAAAAAGAGCCDLDFVDAQGSVEFKRQVVVEQFQRIGGIELGPQVLESRSLTPFTGYRTRVRLGVDASGQVGLRRRGSNGVVALGADGSGVCAQWAPGLAEGLAEELAAHELTPGAEVCVALGDDGVRGIVEVPPRPPRAHTRRRRHGAKRPAAAPRSVLAGDGNVTRTIGDRACPVPVESFWQAHAGASAHYAAWVARNTAQDATVGWDLYGGAGVLAAAMLSAAPGIAVDCVDIASPATGAGRTGLAGRDVSFVTADVGSAIGTLRAPSVVVLDPPRTGAGREVVEAIAAREPAVVLHIGCDPATAARDAASFLAHGYEPEAVEVVDAFGLTHHVEVLVRYVRTPGHGNC